MRRAALLALALWCGTLPALADELRAGFGVAPLPAEPGAPLGGYGGLWDRKAEGMHDPPEARAVIVELGAERLALATVDVVIARGELRDEVSREIAALELDGLLLAATHTHSGPGGYIEGLLATRITSGSFDPEIRAGIVRAAADALRAAAADLRSATLRAGETEVELAVNRRHADGARERALPMIELVREGAAPIVLFAYGAHATTRSAGSHEYSADYIGAARDWLEQRGARAIFFAGPLGDQGPRPAQLRVPENADPESAWGHEIGEALGSAVWNALPSLRANAPALALAERTLDVDPLELRRFCALWWLSPLVRGAAQRTLARRAPLQAWTLGDARLLAIPAEPTSDLGSELRAAIATHAPGATAFVIAHANEWLGYALTETGYRRGGYESCLSFQGPGFGARLVSESNAALEALAQGAP
jgi:neutral ceramidase